MAHCSRPMVKPSPSIHLMAINDNEVEQYLYRQIIQRSGVVASTVMFSLATEALEHLLQPEGKKTDLILLDIYLPEMNGFEFLEAAAEKLGKDFPWPTIVMMTSSRDPQDIERARTFEAVSAVIQKPLTVDILQAWSDPIDF